MEKEDMKKCPYCAEMIKADAVKCRYCGSSLAEKNAEQQPDTPGNYWRRVYEGKRVAGVCTGIAREFNAPKLILPLRIFFILTTFFYGFGFIVYIVLWMLMPAPIDKPATETPADTENKKSLTEAGYQKKIDPTGALLGFLLVLTGVILMLSPMSRVPFMNLPFHFHLDLPRFIHDAIFFNINLITGLWPILMVVGLLVLFFGALKVFRVVIGCGLIAISALFLILFIPFLPKIWLFPGMLLIGLLLIIIGGLKLLFGSSKVVKQKVVTSQDIVSDEEWNPHNE